MMVHIHTHLVSSETFRCPWKCHQGYMFDPVISQLVLCKCIACLNIQEIIPFLEWAICLHCVIGFVSQSLSPVTQAQETGRCLPGNYRSLGKIIISDRLLRLLAIAVKLITNSQSCRPKHQLVTPLWPRLLRKNVYSPTGWWFAEVAGSLKVKLVINRYTVVHQKPSCGCWGRLIRCQLVCLRLMAFSVKIGKE